MELFRYEADPRSIPVLGDTNGVVGISSASLFSIPAAGGELVLNDPESGNGNATVTHMQYRVKQNNA